MNPFAQQLADPRTTWLWFFGRDPGNKLKVYRAPVESLDRILPLIDPAPPKHFLPKIKEQQS